jgi:hypothetical protein
MTVHLAEEHRMLQNLIARFVDEHLIPLEPRVIERDNRGQYPKLTEGEEATRNFDMPRGIPECGHVFLLALWAARYPQGSGTRPT